MQNLNSFIISPLSLGVMLVNLLQCNLGMLGNIQVTISDCCLGMFNLLVNSVVFFVLC